MQSAKAYPLAESAWTGLEMPPAICRRTVLEYYDREQTSLFRYLVSLGVVAGTAEELVHDSFLKLHEHLRDGGDQTNLRAWLYRVAHNLARNTQASAHYKTGSLASIPESAEPATPSVSAEVALLEQERTRELRRAIAQLNAAQKNCLLLRSQGLKYREIAQVLDLSVSTVAEHIQRGLEHLKEAL